MCAAAAHRARDAADSQRCTARSFCICWLYLRPGRPVCVRAGRLLRRDSLRFSHPPAFCDSAQRRENHAVRWSDNAIVSPRARVCSGKGQGRHRQLPGHENRGSQRRPAARRRLSLLSRRRIVEAKWRGVLFGVRLPHVFICCDMISPRRCSSCRESISCAPRAGLLLRARSAQHCGAGWLGCS